MSRADTLEPIMRLKEHRELPLLEVCHPSHLTQTSTRTVTIVSHRTGMPVVKFDHPEWVDNWSAARKWLVRQGYEKALAVEPKWGDILSWVYGYSKDMEVNQ